MSVAIERDIDLAKSAKTLKESNNVTFLKAIRDVSNEKRRATGTLLISSTVDRSPRTSRAIIPRPTTSVWGRRSRTVAIARGRT